MVNQEEHPSCVTISRMQKSKGKDILDKKSDDKQRLSWLFGALMSSLLVTATRRLKEGAEDLQVCVKPQCEIDEDSWAVEGCNSTECGHLALAQSRSCENHTMSTIHNQSTWMLLRGAYIATVGPGESSIKLDHGNGFKVPYTVGHSAGKGRGLFATQDVPEGALIWTPEHTALFYENNDFRKFLACLPDELVCDLLEWCYVEDDEGEWVIACDLDDGSLMNEITNEGDVEYNAECKSSSLFALRPIPAGEELGK